MKRPAAIATAGLAWESAASLCLPVSRRRRRSGSWRRHNQSAV